MIGEIPRSEKLPGNRKKMRGKKKEKSALDRLANPLAALIPNLPPRNPNADALGLWATKDGPWPEGLDYNTEYHYDREILCESDDEDLVKAIDKDEFGNHAMLMVRTILYLFLIQQKCSVHYCDNHVLVSVVSVSSHKNKSYHRK